jgi:hypothetical protein
VIFDISLKMLLKPDIDGIDAGAGETMVDAMDEEAATGVDGFGWYSTSCGTVGFGVVAGVNVGVSDDDGMLLPDMIGWSLAIETAVSDLLCSDILE